MNSLSEFKNSLTFASAPNNLSPQLLSLWYDGKGDWKKAHDQVDHLSDKDSAWVHAYLHRKEGDLWNADYWYGRAKKIRPNISLENEWSDLVLQFL